VILGAGAAGLFCAAQAGQRGLKVLLIDHAEKVAEKIRISGADAATSPTAIWMCARRTSTMWARTRSSAARPCRATPRRTSSP
jgi:phytoene dehydrogenase-like protein